MVQSSKSEMFNFTDIKFNDIIKWMMISTLKNVGFMRFEVLGTIHIMSKSVALC